MISENLIPLLAQVVRENVELRLIFDVSGRLASNSFESEELEIFDERKKWLSIHERDTLYICVSNTGILRNI